MVCVQLWVRWKLLLLCALLVLRVHACFAELTHTHTPHAKQDQQQQHHHHHRVSVREWGSSWQQERETAEQAWHRVLRPPPGRAGAGERGRGPPCLQARAPHLVIVASVEGGQVELVHRLCIPQTQV